MQTKSVETVLPQISILKFSKFNHARNIYVTELSFLALTLPVLLKVRSRSCCSAPGRGAVFFVSRLCFSWSRNKGLFE